MDLRSIFDLELKGLENTLEVESVPRILACTLLFTAFTTNYLNCNLFKVEEVNLCPPPPRHLQVHLNTWRRKEKASLFHWPAVLQFLSLPGGGSTRKRNRSLFPCPELRFLQPAILTPFGSFPHSQFPEKRALPSLSELPHWRV